MGQNVIKAGINFCTRYINKNNLDRYHDIENLLKASHIFFWVDVVFLLVETFVWPLFCNGPVYTFFYDVVSLFWFTNLVRAFMRDNILANYTDIIVAVVVAIIVAMLTITITMFTFLKANLDRKIDEDKYIFETANIYQQRSANRLKKVSFLNLMSLVLILIWHLRISFASVHSSMLMLLGLAVLVLFNILSISTTCTFWNVCIQLNEELIKINNERRIACAKRMHALLNDRFSKTTEEKLEMDQQNEMTYQSRLYFLLGDWQLWTSKESKVMDTFRADQAKNSEKRIKIDLHLLDDKVGDKNDNIDEELKAAVKRTVEFGKNFCEDLSRDRFLNLFARAEELLLNCSHNKDASVFTETDIITVLQERENVIAPIIDNRLLKKDFSDRHYGGNGIDIGAIEQYIDYFNCRIGYIDRDYKKRDEFFEETEELYKSLLVYRNIILSRRKASRDEFNENPSNEGIEKKVKADNVQNAEAPGDVMAETSVGSAWMEIVDENTIDPVMVLGLYYFYLRILGIFVSAVHISDFTFNGATLTWGNFYSSTLNRVSLYAALFYQSVFARARIIDSDLDISAFSNVYFFNTQIENSSFNNCLFRQVDFEDAMLTKTSLNIGNFELCKMKDTTVEQSLMSRNIFKKCTLERVSFTGTILENTIWEDTSVVASDFQQARIKGWLWKSGNQTTTTDQLGCFRFCDFSEAQMDDMNFNNLDMTSSVFNDTLMAGVTIDGCVLRDSLFIKANLAKASIRNCPSGQMCSFQNANLYDAKLERCDFLESNLFYTSATYASLIKINLEKSDCTESSFRAAKLISVKFPYARLFNATFNNASIKWCVFEHALADNIQFTYAKCYGSSFKMASMQESNYSGTRFIFCLLFGTGLLNSVFYQTYFEFSRIIHADFSHGRFVESKMSGCREIEYCDFSSCTFELSKFTETRFVNCNFTQVLFSECTFTDVEFDHCYVDGLILNKKRFESISVGSKGKPVFIVA